MSEPTTPLFPTILHGGDYNPDQWRHVPGTMEEDFRLFREAGLDSVTLGVFAWSALEPEEGRFEWDWLDEAMDRAARAGMRVILATPSAACPPWLGERYPEVRRMHPPTPLSPPVREEHGSRNNHCPTSPVYRAKVAEIDRRLAERYGRHPALALWHIANETMGDCHCPLCRAAFRDWLRVRYHDSLDELNHAWWTDFWSHRYSAWDEIGALDPVLPGMSLDWTRFMSERHADFLRAEIATVRAFSPGVPATTNRVGVKPPWISIDEARFAEEVDVAALDAYPPYHDRPDASDERVLSRYALFYDMWRCLKQRPFALMESVPGTVNWHRVNRLPRPGQHRAKSLQAVAHGADTVQYFQLRKGRGGTEQHHGAVIDHAGPLTADTRMFAEVRSLSADLAALSGVRGTGTPAAAALVWDWESQWALAFSSGPNAAAKDALQVAMRHHAALRRHGLNVDLVPPWADFSAYRLVVLPVLHMVRPGFADHARAFVEGGGTLVATALTGWVDEHARALPGGFPGGGLRELFGVWEEECDSLYEDEENAMLFPNGLRASVHNVATRLRPDPGTETLAAWERDFYADEPAATLRRTGKGRAIYLGGALDPDALAALYAGLADEAGVPRLVASELPPSLDVASRVGADGTEWLFVVNPTAREFDLDLGPAPRQDAFTGAPAPRILHVGPHDSFVLVGQRK